ncbi:MAG: hypothetical protein ACM3ME_06670 [Chloroflexota bacterium]
MANEVINTASLNRTSEKYDPVLKTLPFAFLNDVLTALGINILEIAGKDTFVTFNRLGGISKPYRAGVLDYSKLGKMTERSLEVKTSYAALKEHIMNYKGKLLTTNDPNKEKVNNQTKKHPLEYFFLSEMVKTTSEDIIDAIFHAEYDVTDKSPLGMFDGICKHIADDIAAGEVSVAKGNMFNTGAIVAPANDTDTTAYYQLVDFIRAANPYLRKNAILYISNTILFHAQDALGNKLVNKDVMEFDVFLEHLRGVTAAPNLQIKTSDAIGTGDQLILTVERNLDLGLNTKGDHQFVQVRNPYEDPNLVQFWSQWDAGTRVRHIHPKLFLVNDGVPVSSLMSGDYVVS